MSNNLNDSVNQLLNAVNAYGAALNYQNQKKAAEYQKDMNDKSLRFAYTQLSEGIRQFDTSMDWAKAESARNQMNIENQISNTVRDAERNGINPLAVLGMSAGAGSIASAPGGNVAGSFSPSGYSAPQLDTSILAQFAHDSYEKKEDRKVLREELDIKRKEIERQENRDWQDYLIATENQNIELKRIDEAVRSHVADEEIRRALLDETKRQHLASEVLQRLGLDEERARRALEESKNDHNYQVALAQIQHEKDKLAQEKDQANKQRRMEYITRLTHTAINAVVRVATSMFGKGGSVPASNPIGFFAD